jgi:hypothetical protein
MTPCDYIRSLDGSTAIACSRNRRKPCSVPGCSSPATQLCDFPLKGAAEGRTCSRNLCQGHATTQPDGKEFCPPHHGRTP